MPRYNAEQRRRHEVRPGLSGLAQVNGRNAISWEDKFKYDVQYVDHVTFLGDWKIIFQTILNVIKRDGINSETAATMEVFMGTEEVFYNFIDIEAILSQAEDEEAFADDFDGIRLLTVARVCNQKGQDNVRVS